MKFNVNQQDIQKSLNYCQGVIEKRSTLPILSNVLLDASNSKLTVIATDLDLIFINIVPNIEIVEEGKTTTSSSIMYDIVRKFSSGNKIQFSSIGENKLLLITSITIMDEYYETKKKIEKNKNELLKLTEKFKELKSLIYDYKNIKEIEIKKLNGQLNDLKNEIEKNNHSYESIIDRATDQIENFIKKAHSENQIQ